MASLFEELCNEFLTIFNKNLFWMKFLTIFYGILMIQKQFLTYKQTCPINSLGNFKPDSLEFLTISLILRLNLMVTNNLFWGKTRWSQKIITETVKKGRYWGYLKLKAISDLSKKCFDLIKMNMPGHMWLVKVRTDYVYVLCSLS